MRPFRFDRHWAFDAAPEVVWTALTRTGDYQRWWPWLREFSGDGLVPGGRTTCVVRAPVPYTLCFTVAVTELVPGERIEALVDGDVTGPARLDISAIGARSRASQVRLAWEVELQRPILRAAASVGRPVMKWGHDWVTNTGFEQFCRSALRVEVGHDHHDNDRGDDDRGAGTAGYGT